ncbi:hypothetical protein [Nonomuraea angiospora]
MSHDRFPGRLSLPLSFPDRRFRLWTYVPSHSELVLRTELEPPAPHIELLFKAVRHLDLPVTMSGGLVIEVEDRRPGDTDDVTFLLSNDPFAGHLFMK